ncbi:flagellar protein FliS [Pseudogulbenkiania sp. NH8B]|uniref:flagellar export chaperone FliS n=1 Tax=Pseudogulbenkiania TaxID=568394 RepID=UPI0002279460|nr:MULTISPECIES: flagellar export chaperone FliS [Pseudogulbenkiania]BAK75326.1 flagellar protein FliS [Pseudogulbenkiania sp. NH8B]
MLNKHALRQLNQAYEKDALVAAVYGASPVGIVVLLYKGAANAIAQAGNAINMQDYASKARLISKAIDILDGLREMTNLEEGGDAARNLNDLYLYMKARLALAGKSNDQDILAEVRSLLDTLLPAWVELDKREYSGAPVSAVG